MDGDGGPVAASDSKGCKLESSNRKLFLVLSLSQILTLTLTNGSFWLTLSFRNECPNLTLTLTLTNSEILHKLNLKHFEM